MLSIYLIYMNFHNQKYIWFYKMELAEFFHKVHTFQVNDGHMEEMYKVGNIQLYYKAILL